MLLEILEAFYIFFQHSLKNKNFKRTKYIFLLQMYSKSVTFDQFNIPFMVKSVNFFKHKSY